MKSLLSTIIMILLYLTYLLTGISALFINLGIVNEVAGFWGLVIGLFIFPIVLVVAPFYAFFEFNDLFPLIITYGGTIIAIILNIIHRVVVGEFIEWILTAPCFLDTDLVDTAVDTSPVSVHDKFCMFGLIYLQHPPNCSVIYVLKLLVYLTIVL